LINEETELSQAPSIGEPLGAQLRFWPPRLLS